MESGHCRQALMLTLEVPQHLVRLMEVMNLVRAVVKEA